MGSLRLREFFKELRRRRVDRVAAMYLVVGWLLIQVLDTLSNLYDYPEWVLTILAIGLPVLFFPVIIGAWFIGSKRLTPTAVKEDSNVAEATNESKKIFISYRRSETSGHAGRLHDKLAQEFGAQSVFMDIDAIELGEDFRVAVNRALDATQIVLVLIGKQWAELKDEKGVRRLDDPNDLVRNEISLALDRKIPIIPILLQSASMPKPESLPDALRDLVWRNAHEVSDRRWNYDVDLLLEAIRRMRAIS